MSKELGALTFGHDDAQVFLGRELGQNRGYSEEVAASIDREARKMMDHAYERCTEILSEHIDQLHIIAKVLYEKETVEAEEFMDLMNGRTLNPPTADELVIDAEPVKEDDHVIYAAAPAETEAAETAEAEEAVAEYEETMDEGAPADEIEAEIVETTGTENPDEEQK